MEQNLLKWVAVGKHVENDYFMRTFKFETSALLECMDSV
jgi:hypothetical protein